MSTDSQPISRQLVQKIREQLFVGASPEASLDAAIAEALPGKSLNRPTRESLLAFTQAERARIFEDEKFFRKVDTIIESLNFAEAAT